METMLLYHLNNQDYAFCSERCAKLFRAWPSEVIAVKLKAGVSFGCFWCGEDLTTSLDIDWIEP
jgi:hypothetical protein